jgi:hypothetical protein
MKKYNTLLLCFALLLSGCATSSLSYNKPYEEIIENSVVVNEKFEIVWDRLVKNLSSDFFVINNIEKRVDSSSKCTT